MKLCETMFVFICTVKAYTTHRMPFQDISRCFGRLCKVDRFVVAKRIWRAFGIHICSLFPQRVNPMMIDWSKAIQLEWLKSDVSPGWHGFLNEIWYEQFHKTLVICCTIGVYSLPSYIGVSYNKPIIYKESLCTNQYNGLSCCCCSHGLRPLDLRAGNPEHIDFGHAVLAKFVLERCYKKQFFQLIRSWYLLHFPVTRGKVIQCYPISQRFGDSRGFTKSQRLKKRWMPITCQSWIMRLFFLEIDV